MESPLERGGAESSMSGREGSETGRAEHMYAAEEHDQESSGSSISTDNEWEREGAEVEELPVPASKKGESEHDSDRKSEESDSRTDKSSDDDAETEDDPGHGDASSEDCSVRAADQGTLAGKEEAAGDRMSYLQGEPVLRVEKFTSPSSGDGGVREAKEITAEIAGSSKQVLGDLSAGSSDFEGELLGDNVEVPISVGKEEYQRDENSYLESLKLSGVEESKSLPSPVITMKNEGSDLMEFDEHGSEDATNVEDAYVKKGFTCDGETEEDDEQLREYWTRALQTSTSTGEIVEEIVKVLKHRQKTHDLMCPVCGSCVTRRVILRKRKRSSLISVDRWYRDTLDEEEAQEQEGALPEVPEAVDEPDMQEDHDIEAFGCLSCFSLFFNKGRQLFSRLQADIGPDTFKCFPFFFPPYPWGMTQMRPRIAESHVEVSRSEEIEESVEPADVRASFTRGMGSTLLPDYPWGTMPCTLKGSREEGSSVAVSEEAPLLGVQDSIPLDVRPDFTCGIGSTLLPDYPWGTLHFLSKGWVNHFRNILVVPWEMKDLVKFLNPQAVEMHCS